MALGEHLLQTTFTGSLCMRIKHSSNIGGNFLPNCLPYSMKAIAHITTLKVQTSPAILGIIVTDFQQVRREKVAGQEKRKFVTLLHLQESSDSQEGPSSRSS